MKRVTSEFKAELAKNGAHNLAYCWLIQREDDAVFAFTSHDRDLVFDLEAFVVAQGYAAPPGIVATGVQTYLAATSFVPSNVSTQAALNIDNLEIKTILDSSSILEDDLRAGIWDTARFCVFIVNWADLTMGAIIERVGQLGDVNTGRATAVVEMSGLMRAFQNTIGRMTSPLCDADVFDARCKVDAGGSGGGSAAIPFTVTGALTGVSSDGMTMFDTTRTEPGPTTPAANIVSITNANPAVVTIDADLGITNYQAITLYDIVGPSVLNGVTVARNVADDGLSFELGIDTSDTAIYLPYVGSGKVSTTETSGWFDGGLITMSSGPNNGRKMEVRTYVPGQWVLWLPFPELCEVGDTYTMTAGCNKELLGDCKNKYANGINHRGFTWLAGNDRLVQIGRRS